MKTKSLVQLRYFDGNNYLTLGVYLEEKDQVSILGDVVLEIVEDINKRDPSIRNDGRRAFPILFYKLAERFGDENISYDTSAHHANNHIHFKIGHTKEGYDDPEGAKEFWMLSKVEVLPTGDFYFDKKQRAKPVVFTEADKTWISEHCPPKKSFLSRFKKSGDSSGSDSEVADDVTGDSKADSQEAEQGSGRDLETSGQSAGSN